MKLPLEKSQTLFSELPMAKNMDNKQILRAAIIAEYDAVKLYSEMAANTDNEDVRKILLDVASEEKTHIGEFEALLDKIDPQHREDRIKGYAEVHEMHEKLN